MSSPNRRLCADRRLPDRRAGRPRRLDRLAVLAAFRFGGVLCRAARLARARPLADRAARGGPQSRAATGRTRWCWRPISRRADGAATLVDFMPLQLRPFEIVRFVIGTRGKLAMHTELILRFGYGAVVPWVSRARKRRAARHRRARHGGAATRRCMSAART